MKKKYAIAFALLILAGGILLFLWKAGHIQKGGEPPDRKSVPAAEHPGHEAAPRADVQEAQKEEPAEEPPTVEIPVDRQQMIGVKTIGVIPKELTEIKTTVLKQPSIADLSLVAAAYEHPEVRGIITYDNDFARIATAGLVERKAPVKFWLGNAKEFVEKHRLRLPENEEKEDSESSSRS